MQHSQLDRHPKSRKRSIYRLLIAGFVIIFFTSILALIGGIFAKSLSVISEVLHMASDLAGIIVNIFSLALSGIPSNKTLTFGWHRAGTYLYISNFNEV